MTGLGYGAGIDIAAVSRHPVANLDELCSDVREWIAAFAGTSGFVPCFTMGR